MKQLNFAENLIKLRQKKKLTQKQLADAMGVTKASVSKWENGQSLPDILLLPQLASFFDISIDGLLGYAPQLSREQIKNLYHQLASEFAQKPFEEVMGRSRELVRNYYSCYPFLFQVCILWMNHFMLAESREGQEEVLSSILELCEHIIADCRDMHICNDAVMVKAMTDLQLGKTKEAIETLEEVLDPFRLSRQSDDLLIQAYQAAGEMKKADSYTQISMYLHLISSVSSATQYLVIHSGDLAVCEETVRRIDPLITMNHLETLHPGTVCLYDFQMARIFCLHGKTQEALKRLEHYAGCVEQILKRSNLHGDSYFNAIESWFEQLDIGSGAPRDKKVILESAVQVFADPAFDLLAGNASFQKMKKSLLKKGENL